MRTIRLARVLCLLLLVGCSTAEHTTGPPADATALREEVMETERAFADTMARRDLAAFTAYLSDEAVFMSGGRAMTGKAQVVEAWSVLFAPPDAPFSWEPEQVQVLASGRLALSTGPVLDPAGTRVGTFTSIWRREDDGVWRIVFDKGD